MSSTGTDHHHHHQYLGQALQSAEISTPSVVLLSLSLSLSLSLALSVVGGPCNDQHYIREQTAAGQGSVVRLVITERQTVNTPCKPINSQCRPE